MPDPPPGLDYPALLHRALRGMVREILARVAREGLPGEHHFYLTFRTSVPGVVLPEPLRRQHPAEMTIILQHQCWDLQVADDAFAVTLRFSGVPTRIGVPFEALTAFVDPSVSFGVRLAAEERSPPEPSEAEPATRDEIAPPAATTPRPETGVPTEGAANVVAFRRPKPDRD